MNSRSRSWVIPWTVQVVVIVVYGLALFDVLPVHERPSALGLLVGILAWWSRWEWWEWWALWKRGAGMTLRLELKSGDRITLDQDADGLTICIDNPRRPFTMFAEAELTRTEFAELMLWLLGAVKRFANLERNPLEPKKM